MHGALAGATLGPIDSVTPVEDHSDDDSMLELDATAVQPAQLVPHSDHEPGSQPSMAVQQPDPQQQTPALEGMTSQPGQPHGLQRIDQDHGAQLSTQERDQGLPPADPAPADLKLRGGRSMVELVGMWDALAPRLPADASPAAQTLLSALKLAVARSTPIADQQAQTCRQSAAAVGPGLGTVAATGGDGSGALAIALRLADISSAGVPVDADAIAAGMLAGASPSVDAQCCLSPLLPSSVSSQALMQTAVLAMQLGLVGRAYVGNSVQHRQ